MSRYRPAVVFAICLVNLPTLARGQAVPTRTVVADGGSNIILATSESGKTLYGYTLATGIWEGLAVENPDNTRSSPMIGNGVACVAIDKKIHAFSAATGHWATLELPELASPKLGPGRIRVDIGTKMHMFSGVTGKWATVDLAVDKK